MRHYVGIVQQGNKNIQPGRKKITIGKKEFLDAFCFFFSFYHQENVTHNKGWNPPQESHLPYYTP